MRKKRDKRLGEHRGRETVSLPPPVSDRRPDPPPWPGPRTPIAKSEATSYICTICWTSSYDPCPEGTKDAVHDPGRPGEWMRCAMCFTHDGMLRYKEALDAYEAFMRDHYPTLAGRVIHLQGLGEEKAAASALKVATDLFAAHGKAQEALKREG